MNAKSAAVLLMLAASASAVDAHAAPPSEAVVVFQPAAHATKPVPPRPQAPTRPRPAPLSPQQLQAVIASATAQLSPRRTAAPNLVPAPIFRPPTGGEAAATWSIDLGFTTSDAVFRANAPDTGQAVSMDFESPGSVWQGLATFAPNVGTGFRHALTVTWTPVAGAVYVVDCSVDSDPREPSPPFDVDVAAPGSGPPTAFATQTIATVNGHLVFAFSGFQSSYFGFRIENNHASAWAFYGCTIRRVS
jgi:hypothetical protein